MKDIENLFEIDQLAADNEAAEEFEEAKDEVRSLAPHN